ncbi:discoidin domain-containing protein [Alteromonas halophila]|uniref:F5/8 type C domain-containing protein n=1 Tax=Alteromonas halophila TaxID=516698 RepID=A0A918MYX2_9ALTE|nr:discoidin domain-containing protein [Alteromonas halophila]GGW84814.1 hypothetical protein GCM10007391_18230 [Alteromonas halophila]
MNTFTIKPLSALVAVALTGLYGCGGADSPDPQDIPKTVEYTSADVRGSVVKGTVSNAAISVQQMNGAELTIDDGGARTNSNGVADFSVTGAEGFGLDGMVKITATADSESAMVCDAANCAGVTTGGMLSGEPLSGTSFTTMSYVDVPYANAADGTADAAFQANALTTMGTRLVEADIDGGRNVSVRQLFELALADSSADVVKALGSTVKLNVFNEPLISAESYSNFVVDEQCSEPEEGQQASCEDVLASTDVIKLSLLNAAFADMDEAETMTGKMDEVMTAITAAREGDESLLPPLREALMEDIAAMPVLAALGLTAEDIIDPTLAFSEPEASSGPVREVTTADNIASATITARNSISDNENQFKAFDGDPSTKWLDHNDYEGAPTVEDPSWIEIQFAEAHAVNTLYITSANDAPGRDPQNFNLLASNDGETWVTLAEFVGVNFDERFERQAFRFSNGLEYSHYRLNITKNRNDDQLMQLAEIALVGPIYPSVDHTDPVGTVSLSARSSISDAEAEDKAFDNNPETKWLDDGGVPTDDEPSWVEVTFPEAVAVDTLAITSANDAPARDPQNFNLQGSNDGGETWVALGEWVGENFDDRFTRNTFSVDNSLSYSLYRLNITKNKGDAPLMQLAEIELIGPVTADVNHSLTDGRTVTERYAISDAESGEKAFDGDPQTKWLDHNDWAGAPTAEDPAWAEVAFPAPVTVNKLALISANDAPSRDPQNFNLQASDDGENWVTLSGWIGENFDERFERRQFSFSNDLGYKFYRFNVTKNRGDDTLMQVAEIELIGPVYSSVDLSMQAGVSVSASSGDAPAAVIDGDTATRWSATAGEETWLDITLPASQIVNSIAITNGEAANSPADFVLLGSNDGGETWHTVESWSGETWDNGTQRTLYDMANGFAYTTYRLAVSQATDSDTVEIAEIELIGPQQ